MMAGEDDLGCCITSDSLRRPTWTGDIVLLQSLVVSTGTHSSSWDGKAKGTTASIIHTARILTWEKQIANTLSCLFHLIIQFLSLWILVPLTTLSPAKLILFLMQNPFPALFRHARCKPYITWNIGNTASEIYDIFIIFFRGDNLSTWTKLSLFNSKKTSLKLSHMTPLSLQFNTFPKSRAWTNEIKLLVLWEAISNRHSFGSPNESI